MRTVVREKNLQSLVLGPAEDFAVEDFAVEGLLKSV